MVLDTPMSFINTASMEGAATSGVSVTEARSQARRPCKRVSRMELGTGWAVPKELCNPGGGARVVPTCLPQVVIVAPSKAPASSTDVGKSISGTSCRGEGRGGVGAFDEDDPAITGDSCVVVVVAFSMTLFLTTPINNYSESNNKCSYWKGNHPKRRMLLEHPGGKEKRSRRCILAMLLQPHLRSDLSPTLNPVLYHFRVPGRHTVVTRGRIGTPPDVLCLARTRSTKDYGCLRSKGSWA
jgi:hypothetical protein